MVKLPLPYDFNHSYWWNFKFGPRQGRVYAAMPKTQPTKFLGFKVNSPLGVAAGPLPNSRWVAYFAKLGFDVLTYKTVRSRTWPVNPMPNVRYVRLERGAAIYEKGKKSRTITNSFGMPSVAPGFWIRDIGKAKMALGPGQILIGSAVGSPGKLSLAQDFAKTAKMVAQAGAPIVEINLSCPNVEGEGILCQDIGASRQVLREVRAALGKKPLLVKISALPKKKLFALLAEIARYAQGVVAINSISYPTRSHGRTFLVGGRAVSGVCGQGIKTQAVKTLKEIIAWKRRYKAKMTVVSVGGVMTPQDINQRLKLGADLVLVATAALLRPQLAIEFKAEKA